MLDAVLPPYRPPPAVAALPPAAAAELPHRQQQKQQLQHCPRCCQQKQQLQHCPRCCQQKQQLQHCPRCCQQKQQEHRYLHQPHHRHQYWHQCPTITLPACHHHPHGFHGLNQTAEVRDEAGGEEEDKAGEPYSTLKTHILIISIIKFFNLSPFEN